MAQSNSTLAQRWMKEVWNDRLEGTIDEMLLASAKGHSYGNSSMQGPQGFRQFRSALLQAIPDLKIDVLETVEQGNNVVVRWRAHGKHQGEGLGMAATGEQVDFWGMTWLRFSNGKIEEGWDAWNQGAVMQQLSIAAAKLFNATTASAQKAAP